MTLTLLSAGPLTASLDDRTLTGLLLPHGEEGRTNLGRLTASAESALDLADLVPLNVEHKPQDVIGKAVAIEKAPDGLRASFRVLETPAGDVALLEAAEGLRACLSVEIDPIVTRGGRIVSGTVTGAALVARPAFPSARLAAAEDGPVPDLGDDDTDPAPETPDVVIDGEKLPGVESVDIAPEQITITTTENEAPALAASEHNKESDMTAPVVQTPALLGAPKKDETAATLFATLAAAHKSGGEPGLMAALADVIPANTLGIEQPAFVGEIWKNAAFERKVAPLIGSAPLSNFSIAGWEWTTKPQVAKYAGAKADIPSASIATAAHTKTAQRFAGGHDIDRRFVDFGNTEFLSSYFAAMAESYKRVSDAYVLEQLIASGHNLAGQQKHLDLDDAPAGVPLALWLIVEGVSQVIADTDQMPTFALVEADLWKPLLYTKVDDVLAYLDAAIGWTEGSVKGGFKIVPMATGTLTDPDADAGGPDVAFAGKVMVGTRQAATHYELPGSPIRVSAPDVGRAGVDEALYGYSLVDVTQPKGFVLFDTPTA